MHKSYFETGTGIQNRRGASYRSYADGKLTNNAIYHMLVATDIYAIWLEKGSSASDSDKKVLAEICFQYNNREVPEELLRFMSIAFEFGFMMGGKSVRIKKKRRQKPIPSTACEKAPQSALTLSTDQPT